MVMLKNSFNVSVLSQNPCVSKVNESLLRLKPSCMINLFKVWKSDRNSERLKQKFAELGIIQDLILPSYPKTLI